MDWGLGRSRVVPPCYQLKSQLLGSAHVEFGSMFFTVAEAVFVMRSGPGASPDPYANRAQMLTSEALAASQEQQYLAASQTRDMQEQTRLQELAQARDRGMDAQQKSGMTIS
ncbi:hypothetical protein [Xanthomonas cerealis]|uniref:hypothetical protein n=1 Tax=Xanthomonas cerealis TaxID=3390025 RepID=UPI0021AFC91D|nr:hypothetical protein [Xanthomonas translucens]